MFRHLCWKEWRENLWKLVFCGAVSLGFTALLFRVRLFPDSQNCIIISFVQMLAVPVVYALDIFSGEMSNRTIHLLFKFPVPRWKIFFSKYLISIGGMIAVFLVSGLLMEMIAQGRETERGFLLKVNASFGVAALILFTWFCGFGAQSRSEAGSLTALFGVMIGWGIIFFWSGICVVEWAFRFVPFSLLKLRLPVDVWDSPLITIASQFISFALILSVACYRFVKVRRYL
jgi:ABC-type transport system involved in multi-copper enzyme maturation permease subunit